MCQDQIFLDETGCVLNEKMMPDATVMVPDVEIGKKVSSIYVFGGKMWWQLVLHNRYDGYKIDTAPMMVPRPETAKGMSCLLIFDSYNIKMFNITRRSRWTN
jgi:hypothetical protein